MITHRSIMPQDPSTQRQLKRGNELSAMYQRLDIELEGCALVVAAGGYLCSVREVPVSRSLINNGIMQMGNLSPGTAERPAHERALPWSF